MKVICDTNIIIDLSKIHHLDLLRRLFDEVIIPNEVKEELLAGGGNRDEADIKGAIGEWISIEPVEDIFAVENLQAHIDKGESACIILYKESDADLLAINDLKARGIASALGIKVIGTLGILLLAKDKGLIKEIRPLLDKLRKIGAYISNSLYIRILKDVGEV